MIEQVKGECRHMRIDAMGQAGINNGRHVLSQKPVITNHAIYVRPLTTDDLVAHNERIGNHPDAL